MASQEAVGEVVVEEVAIAQHLEGLKDEKSCIRGIPEDSTLKASAQSFTCLSGSSSESSAGTVQHLLTAAGPRQSLRYPTLPPQLIPVGLPSLPQGTTQVTSRPVPAHHTPHSPAMQGVRELRAPKSGQHLSRFQL